MADEVLACAKDQAGSISHEEVAEALFDELDSLDESPLYRNSVKTWDGYVDIGEEAWRMIEEVVEPSIEEMQKLQASALHKTSREYCIGIMEGLARHCKSGSVGRPGGRWMRRTTSSGRHAMHSARAKRTQPRRTRCEERSKGLVRSSG